MVHFVLTSIVFGLRCVLYVYVCSCSELVQFFHNLKLYELRQIGIGKSIYTKYGKCLSLYAIFTRILMKLKKVCIQIH